MARVSPQDVFANRAAGLTKDNLNATWRIARSAATMTRIVETL